MPWELPTPPPNNSADIQPCATSLSPDEFGHNFANSCTYQLQSDDWPHNTILFFNLKILNKDTGAIVEDRWIRVVNIPNQHAEDRMIEYLLHRKANEPNILFGPILRVYMSYSPCRICSNRLIGVLNQLNTKVYIRFGTFYKHSDNIEGLVKLLINGVVLDIFHGEADWVQFLNDIQVPQADQARYLRDDLTQNRRDREAIDQGMLGELNLEAEHAPQIEQQLAH